MRNYLNLVGHFILWFGITAYVVSKDTDLDWGLFSSRGNTLFWPVCYGVLFNALLFYGNTFWLVPRWIKHRKRYLLYAVCAILAVTVMETVIDVGYALRQASILENTRVEFQDKIKASWTDDFIPALLAVQSFLLNLFMHIVFWALSLAFGLYRERVRGEKIQEILLREKMRAELNYLRAQINPHFLFNGINSIYHLIDQQPEKAKDVLLRFSGLLRYQLYECSSDNIALSKELDYIENYIQLEKTRKGDDAVVGYSLSASSESWKIAPMLLSPLVENAFKYLSQHSDAKQNRMVVDLEIENDWLYLTVKNTFQPELRSPDKSGGLGLENLRIRLGLLYPDRYQLTTSEDLDVFTAQLQLQLNHA